MNKLVSKMNDKKHGCHPTWLIGVKKPPAREGQTRDPHTISSRRVWSMPLTKVEVVCQKPDSLTDAMVRLFFSVTVT